MYSLRLYQLVVILAMGCLQVGICQDKPAENPPAAAELNTELKVFKESLLTRGSVDAATVMLSHEDPNARVVLLDALKQNDNSAARIAVCNALIRAREQKKTIKNDQDFIEPLLGIFASEIPAETEAAAKATLALEREKISPYLVKLVKDSSKPFKVRVNAIQALKIRRDMNTTIKLIELIDELGQTDEAVRVETKRALSELGIAAGETVEARRQKIEEIRREGESEFLRDQLTRQESQMRQVTDEIDEWQKRLLSQLDKAYMQITDDKGKGEFLIEYLNDKKAVVRLWALDKAYKWRLASQLPEALGPVLIGLISDENRNVRLNTADLLALMQRLNSAQSLLDQLQVEQDDQVKSKLFVALGSACASAITGPPAEIPVTMKKIRSTTLEIAAAQYLFSADDEKARNAAEVIRKLLVRDGLEPLELDKYLKLLSAKYQQEKDKPDGVLRGVLLNAMASLCAPESTCKARAKGLYEPMFKEALQDKTDYVREAAVNGLAYISTKKALELLRTNFFNDPSEALRKKLMSLVDEEGDEQDLGKLAEKIGMNSEGELAWQAMLSIFKRLKETNAAVWKEWMGKITIPGGKFTDEQRIAFLKIVETRASPEMKQEARAKLGDLYYATGQYEQAVNYLGMSYQAAQDPKTKETIFPNLLKASLNTQQIERVVALMGNHLSGGDLDPNSVVIQILNDYFGKPPKGANQKAVLKALEEMKTPQGRPKWHHWLKGWKTASGNDEGEKSDKPKPTGS